MEIERIGRPLRSPNQSLAIPQIVILCQLLVSTMKPAKNSLQEKWKSHFMNASNTDIVSTLCETPPEYYQQSGPLVILNTPLTILSSHIPHHQETDKLLTKTISTKVLHTSNLPIHAVDLEKEYQHSLKFKDIYLHIVWNQLPSSLQAKWRVKTDALNYIFFHWAVVPHQYTRQVTKQNTKYGTSHTRETSNS